ncbi:MAG TPA: hypothetical protein VHS31_10685, partial [Tepidisphaeraceae bacterium]|nr:hypothetical protein [Tepidisphaeraceae bacterium]
RMAWSDNMQFRVDELPLMKEAGWPEGLSQIASSIGDPPFHWFSELPDLLASSIYAIDILLSKTQPEAPAIQLNTADKKLAAPNPPESKPQLDPSIRAVLKRLASSETMLVIDDIAGSSGCPRDAKTVGKIVKKLIEDGYAVRPSRYGVKITDKGRQAL